MPGMAYAIRHHSTERSAASRHASRPSSDRTMPYRDARRNVRKTSRTPVSCGGVAPDLAKEERHTALLEIAATPEQLSVGAARASGSDCAVCFSQSQRVHGGPQRRCLRLGTRLVDPKAPQRGGASLRLPVATHASVLELAGLSEPESRGTRELVDLRDGRDTDVLAGLAEADEEEDGERDADE